MTKQNSKVAPGTKEADCADVLADEEDAGSVDSNAEVETE